MQTDYYKVKQNVSTVEDDTNTFEIVVISNNFEEKQVAIDTEFEEFELLEVDNLDVNIESQELKPDLVNDDPNLPLDVLNVEHSKDTPISTERKHKPDVKKHIPSTRKSARQAAKLHKSVHSEDRSEKHREKLKNSSTIKRNDTPALDDMQQDCDDVAEGDSDDEFPARDSDNDDWPSQDTLDDFPKQIMRNGLLLYKGKELMSMICRFVLTFKWLLLRVK